MRLDPGRNVVQLLTDARGGNDRALGQLLEVYRGYIRVLAGIQIDRRLVGKASSSDVVQDTFLHAQQGFRDFRGSTEAEFVAWLRRILASQLAMLVRRYVAGTRDVRLEQQLDFELIQSSDALGGAFHTTSDTPSEAAMRGEEAVLFAAALERLTPDYRDVIVLRHLDGLPFAQIALRMNRTEHSVKNIWARAIAKLRLELIQMEPEI